MFATLHKYATGGTQLKSKLREVRREGVGKRGKEGGREREEEREGGREKEEQRERERERERERGGGRQGREVNSSRLI